jgi:hypothetical protein
MKQHECKRMVELGLLFHHADFSIKRSSLIPLFVNRLQCHTSPIFIQQSSYHQHTHGLVLDSVDGLSSSSSRLGVGLGLNDVVDALSSSVGAPRAGWSDLDDELDGECVIIDAGTFLRVDDRRGVGNLAATECNGTGRCILKDEPAPLMKLMAPARDPVVVNGSTCTAGFVTFDTSTDGGSKISRSILTLAVTTNDYVRETVVVATLEKEMDGRFLGGSRNGTCFTSKMRTRTLRHLLDGGITEGLLCSGGHYQIDVLDRCHVEFLVAVTRMGYIVTGSYFLGSPYTLSGGWGERIVGIIEDCVGGLKIASIGSSSR